MTSPNPRTLRTMNADQFLALAEALRSYAQHSGRDTNASNLFVHGMLMRAIQVDRVEQPARTETKRKAA